MKEHLVVLIHGLQGNVGHMAYLEKKISELNPKILTINATANDQGPFKNWWTTSDGISNGGNRIIKEIQHILSNTDVQSLRTISFIGSSMGGVYARYVAGKLYIPEGLHLYIGTSLWFFRGTGSDLMLTDHPSNPLLYEMASPNSSYFLALKAFSKRVTYASCSAEEWKPLYLGCGLPNQTMIVNTHDDPEGIPVPPQDCKHERYCDDPKVETIIKNLRTVSWTRVDVNLSHSQAAVVNSNRDEIAVHVLGHLEGLLT